MQHWLKTFDRYETSFDFNQCSFPPLHIQPLIITAMGANNVFVENAFINTISTGS